MTTAKDNATANAKDNATAMTNAMMTANNIMIKKSDRHAERAQAKARAKFDSQKIDSKKARYAAASATRLDALTKGLTLAECLAQCVSVINRADKGKAPELANYLKENDIQIAQIKALVKCYATTQQQRARELFAKYINSRGQFDSARAIGAFVSELIKHKR